MLRLKKYLLKKPAYSNAQNMLIFSDTPSRPEKMEESSHHPKKRQKSKNKTAPKNGAVSLISNAIVLL